MEPSRELDALVFEKVMEWVVLLPGSDAALDEAIPPYSTDIAAAWEVEVWIEKAGLQEEYVSALIEVHDLNVMLFNSALENGGDRVNIPLAIWTLIHSTPDEKCCAALKAVGVKGKENEDEAGQGT